MSDYDPTIYEHVEKFETKISILPRVETTIRVTR
jgi:hypothetical protein